MPSAAERTAATNKAIKEYSAWCSKNDTDFVEDPLSISAECKPVVWQECVKKREPLPSTDTKFIEPMDIDHEEEQQQQPAREQTEEDQKKHDEIIEDMSRSSGSLASINKMLKSHTTDMHKVSANVGGNKVRELDLGENISQPVTAPEVFDSEYESSDEEDDEDDEEESLLKKRPREEGEGEEPAKRRKFDKVVAGLSQTGKEREKEFVRRTKGEKAARVLSERQGTVPLSNPAENSEEPDFGEKELSAIRSKKTGKVKREASTPEHPYSQFYSGDNSVVEQVETEEMTDAMDLVEDVDEATYVRFVKSIAGTLYQELDETDQQTALKMGSYYAAKLLQEPYRTGTVRDIDLVVKDMLKPLQDDLVAFVNTVGSVDGDNAKAALLELTRFGRVTIYPSEDDLEASLKRKKTGLTLDQFENRGGSLCNISGKRVQKKTTRRIMVTNTVKAQEIMFKHPKRSSKKTSPEIVSVENVYRVIHRDMEAVVAMVYCASHFWQYARDAFAKAVQKWFDEQKDEIPENYTLRDLYEYLSEADPDNTTEQVKARYQDLRTSLQICARKWAEKSSAKTDEDDE